MKGLQHHINRVKEQPHHVRHRVAMGVAGGITGVIALTWLGVSLATGAFAIQGSGFAQATGQGGLETSSPTSGDTGTNQTAAAAAAVSGGSGTSQVQVIPAEGSGAAAAPAQGGATIIPF